MSQQGFSLAANSSFLFGGTLVQRFLSFFTIILIARYLGPELFGQLNYVISFVTLLALFWNFGINTVITRNVARERSLEGKYVSAGIVSKSVLFIVCILLLFLYFYFFESRTLLYAALIFASGQFIGNLAGVFNSVFIALRRMDYSALINVVRSVILLAGVLFVAFYLPRNLLLFFLSYFASFVAIFFLSIGLWWKNKNLEGLGFSASLVSQTIWESIPFFLTSAVNIFLFRIDHVMLAKLIGEAELGMYSAGYTIFEVIISMLPMMFMASAFPVFSRLYREDTASLFHLYSFYFKYFVWLSVPVSFGIAILAKQICLTLYGAEYLRAGGMLLLLGTGVWIFFLSTLVSWLLTACDRQNIVLFSNFVAMLLNIVFNLVFIPMYGGYGAAGVTLVCELFNFLFMFLILRRYLSGPDISGLYYVTVLSTSIIMAAPLTYYFWGKDQSVGFIVLIAFTFGGALLYGGLSILFRTVKLSELKVLRTY